MERPLYERVGGQEAILAAVDLLYAKILGDPLLSPFFEGVDMQKQVTKMVGFMAYAFGASHEYGGRSLREAHARLVAKKGLSDLHFDRVAQHLEEALVELELPAGEVAEALASIASLRNEVLGR